MIVFVVIQFLLYLFWLLLIARFVVEIVRSIARDWRPSGFVAVILETIFTITDPPIRLVRKVVPPLNLGGVRLDLSIMIVMIAIYVISALLPNG